MSLHFRKRTQRLLIALCLFLTIGIIFPTPRHAAATPSQRNIYRTTPTSPLEIVLSASPLPNNRADLMIRVTTVVDLDRVKLVVEVPSDVRVLSGALPPAFTLQAQQTREHHVVVESAAAAPTESKIISIASKC